jgi:hypothetical protein
MGDDKWLRIAQNYDYKGLCVRHKGKRIFKTIIDIKLPFP